jgi:hypothetical protein
VAAGVRQRGASSCVQRQIRVLDAYLEDVLVDVAPGQSHFTGAADLLDAGLAAIARDFPDVQHVVCVAADSWFYRPQPVRGIIDDVRRDDLRLAAASWEVADDAHGVRRKRGDPTLLPALVCQPMPSSLTCHGRWSSGCCHWT